MAYPYSLSKLVNPQLKVNETDQNPRLQAIKRRMGQASGY